MNKPNQQLQLLREYVKTLQNQMKSKNQQIKTLNIEIQSLSKYQNPSNISRSQVIYTSNCNQCAINKEQFNQLKTKYSALESSSKIKYSSNCSQCSSLKNQLLNLQQKYNSMARQSSSNYSSFVSTSTVNQQIQYFKREYLKILDQKRLLQSQFLKIKQSKQWSSHHYNLQIQNTLRQSKEQIITLRLQSHKKDELIKQLRSQLMSYSQKINNLQNQIQNLARTNSNVQVNSQRLKYLNGQVQHYLALSNSLKSQIQVLKQQNHAYILKLRELQNQPRQVEYVHVQPSFDFKKSILELKRQISDLNRNNIFIQQENENLRLQLIQFSRANKSEPQIIEVIRTENNSPLRVYMKQQGIGKHYKKHYHKDNLKIREVAPNNSYFFEKEKYIDLQRRIYSLQVQNQNLKNNFYTKI